MSTTDQRGNIRTASNGCPGVNAATNGLLVGTLSTTAASRRPALGASSDALDIAAGCPTTDQRGLPRTLGGAT